MTVVRARTAAQRAAALGVRHEVFVVEQGVPADLEVDELDAEADHFLLYDGTAAVGAARLVVEPPGFAGVAVASGRVGHLGRLAVLKPARGAGAGALLVAAVETRASELGLEQMVLAAQTHALGFYARLGYAAYGEEFDDAGLPHRWMRRPLPSAGSAVAGSAV